LAHDYRIMREDRGWLCLPSVDIGIVLPAKLLEVARVKLKPKIYRDMVLRGKRITAKEGLEEEIIDGIASEKELIISAIKIGSSVAPKGNIRKVYGGLKREMYPSLHCLDNLSGSFHLESHL